MKMEIHFVSENDADEKILKLLNKAAPEFTVELKL
jgi:hypothetical protein